MGRMPGYKLKPGELDLIYSALGAATRKEMASIYGASENTLGWWRQRGVPLVHLRRLNDLLIQKIKDRNPTELEVAARALLVKGIAEREASLKKQVKQASGTALPLRDDSPFTEAFSPTMPPDAVHQVAKSDGLVGEGSYLFSLAAVALEALVDEIERRGWEVSLSRSDSTKPGQSRSTPREPER